MIGVSSHKICVECGKNTPTKNYKYCSFHCQDIGSKRKKRQRRKGRFRFKVFRRDGGICSKCGNKDPEWEAHHIIPMSEGGSNHVDNGMTLCKACHSVVTSDWRKSRKVIAS